MDGFGLANDAKKACKIRVFSSRRTSLQNLLRPRGKYSYGKKMGRRPRSIGHPPQPPDRLGRGTKISFPHGTIFVRYRSHFYLLVEM